MPAPHWLPMQMSSWMAWGSLTHWKKHWGGGLPVAMQLMKQVTFCVQLGLPLQLVN